MSKIYMTKGLPASGKSTWAKSLVNGSEGHVKRINKDDLRDMIDNGAWSSENEKGIVTARNALITAYTDLGYDVIIDDTNLNPEMEKGVRRRFGRDHDIVIVDEFLQVDVDECVSRDSRRGAFSVGEKVIRDMWRKWETKWIRVDCTKGIGDMERLTPDPYVPIPGTTDAIIVDIDGTLAHHVARTPYDYSLVGTDAIDPIIRDLVNHYANQGFKILIVSGREDFCKSDTVKWLHDNGVLFDLIWMRPAKDMRKDAIIKKEIFDAKIRYDYNVHFVLDDRTRVVDMWRNILGLKCLQVAEGDF